MGSQRSRCSRELLESIERNLDALETREGLLDAALALSAYVDPDLDLDGTRETLTSWTERIRERSGSNETRAVIARAHQVLFDELDLRGDTEDYYAPENSLLPSVVDRRRGLPITLSLVYKLVVEPLGSEAGSSEGSNSPRVEGLGAPGHFMVRVQGDSGFRAMIVDPFHGGRVRSDDEARQMVRTVVGDEIADQVELLPVVSNRAWLGRIVRNLVGACRDRGIQDCERGLSELLELLEPDRSE
ncbi:MAG: transglutaminase-like domain-containing protein [Planctomycetota bacterium]